MKRKITIIGGSGFIGTNLCRSLSMNQEDFEIVDLKRSRQFPDKTIIADVRDVKSIRNAINGDVVINLAAVHRDDVRDKGSYFATNVEGAQNIVSVCLEKNIKKIIFTSSVAVYGFSQKPIDESGTINPFNEYGRTKYLAEEKFKEWQKSGENKLLIVRPTVVFGEGNRGNVYNLFSQIASKRFIMIGRGNNQKSMAYVRNLVSFLQVCLESKETYGVYNYSDSPNFTMKELVSLVRLKLHNKVGVGPVLPTWLGLCIGKLADVYSMITGMNLPVSYIRVRKFTESTDFASAKNSLDGFIAPFSLSDAVERTLHNEFIEPDPEMEEFYTE